MSVIARNHQIVLCAPPLEADTQWIDVAAAGQSAEVRASPPSPHLGPAPCHP